MPWDDLVNMESNFSDFVRFCPYTYPHTQQFLPPLWAAILKLVSFLLALMLRIPT